MRKYITSTNENIMYFDIYKLMILNAQLYHVILKYVLLVLSMKDNLVLKRCYIEAKGRHNCIYLSKIKINRFRCLVISMDLMYDRGNMILSLLLIVPMI